MNSVIHQSMSDFSNECMRVRGLIRSLYPSQRNTIDELFIVMAQSMGISVKPEEDIFDGMCRQHAKLMVSLDNAIDAVNHIASKEAGT